MRDKKTPQPQTPNEPQGRDLFQTPNYAVDLLVPFIPKSVHSAWECAAGERKIVKRLLEVTDLDVFASDVRIDLEGVTPYNFITDSLRTDMKYHVIITNPPFSLAERFYKRCLEYNLPFALLINATYKQWIIDAVVKEGCEKIIPYRRIDYITPTGLSGATGNTADFHSLWLTKGFNLGGSEIYVDLSLEEKETNI